MPVMLLWYVLVGTAEGVDASVAGLSLDHARYEVTRVGCTNICPLCAGVW